MDTSIVLPQTGAIASAVALALDWLPGLRTWFDKQSTDRQRTISLLIGLIIGVLMFLQANQGFTPASWIDLISVAASLCVVVITAIGSMQLTKFAADRTLGATTESKLTTEVTKVEGNTSTTVKGPSSAMPDATANVTDGTGVVTGTGAGVNVGAEHGG